MELEAQQKAYRYGIIGLIGLIAIFAVWMLFFNKGTLIVSSTPPFTVRIDTTQTETCDQKDCEIVLAPGNYDISVQKEGYKQFASSVNVPVMGTLRLDVNLTLIPIFTELGLESDLNLFEEPFITTDLQAVEEKFIVFIDRNKENGRQTLYYRELQDSSMGVIATSFTRDLIDYKIFSAIDRFNKIAVIDTTETQSTLYVIDLVAKTRHAVLSMPLIGDAKWLDENRLLLDGRNENDNGNNLYLHNLTDLSVKKISIQTTLENIEQQNENTLIAATNQPYSVVDALDPEGELITLSPATTSDAATLSFIEYSLESDTARLLKTATEADSCKKIKLSNDKNSLLCLAPAPLGDKVFELIFNK